VTLSEAEATATATLGDVIDAVGRLDPRLDQRSTPTPA